MRDKNYVAARELLKARLSQHVYLSFQIPQSFYRLNASFLYYEMLPGHEDEVYALDWSPNGASVATGSKDRTIKIWKHEVDE